MNLISQEAQSKMIDKIQLLIKMMHNFIFHSQEEENIAFLERYNSNHKPYPFTNLTSGDHHLLKQWLDHDKNQLFNQWLKNEGALNLEKNIWKNFDIPNPFTFTIECRKFEKEEDWKFLSDAMKKSLKKSLNKIGDMIADSTVQDKISRIKEEIFR